MVVEVAEHDPGPDAPTPVVGEPVVIPAEIGELPPAV